LFARVLDGYVGEDVSGVATEREPLGRYTGTRLAGYRITALAARRLAVGMDSGGPQTAIRQLRAGVAQRGPKPFLDDRVIERHVEHFADGQS